MNSFETRIVRTWQPSKWLRTLVTILLIASAISVFVWQPDIQWLMILSYIVYGITFLFALSFSFIKPKYLGNIFISDEEIEVDLSDEKLRFLISDIKQLGLNYQGYGSFWKYTLQENKDHLDFMLQSGEQFDYEIMLQNKEMKEDLKLYLKRIQKTSQIKVEQSGLNTF